MQRRKRLGQKNRPDSARPAADRGAGLWLYGAHAVLTALANPGRTCRRLLLTAEARQHLAHRLPAAPAPEILPRQRLDQIVPGAVHQGILLLAEPLPELDLDRVAEPQAGRRNIVVLLDRVTDPHNVGAVLRSAAAFGARAVVVTERHAPEATGALAKAASGALELVPLVRVTNLARALDDLADHNYWRIGLDGNAPQKLAEAARGDHDIALVLGAEGEGLRRLTAEKCDLLARLPIEGAIESLNVSNAAAVALYELRRGASGSPG